MGLRLLLLAITGCLLGVGVALVGLRSSPVPSPTRAQPTSAAPEAGDDRSSAGTPRTPRRTAAPEAAVREMQPQRRRPEPSPDEPGPDAAGRDGPNRPVTAVEDPADPDLSDVVTQPLETALLRARLEEAVAAASVSGPQAALALAVADEGGTVHYDHLGDTPLIPASTQKLVTAAAALNSLGPDYRYVTRALASARPEADGTLHGDLILRGSGDPTLTTPEFARIDPDRPSTPLSAIADQVAAAGVRRITGRVVGDAGDFGGDPIPEGWQPGYLKAFDGARAAGLTVNAGRRLFIHNGRLLGEPAEDPVLTTAAELVHLLGQRGIAVDGGPSRQGPVHRGSGRREPGGGEVKSAAVELAAVSSPPLLELLRFMVTRSDNAIADQLFLTVGHAVSGRATWSGGEAAARRVLSPLGLDLSGTRFADGSGLSRANRVSPTVLVQLDAAMSTSPLAEQWESTMAVVGRSGTLEQRLRGTVVDGRARGKTGTLVDVRALVGAVLGPDGGRYHFSLVGNDLDGAGAQALRVLQDEVLTILTEDLYDCLPTDEALQPECRAA